MIAFSCNSSIGFSWLTQMLISIFIGTSFLYSFSEFLDVKMHQVVKLLTQGCKKKLQYLGQDVFSPLPASPLKMRHDPGSSSLYLSRRVLSYCAQMLGVSICCSLQLLLHGNSDKQRKKYMQSPVDISFFHRQGGMVGFWTYRRGGTFLLHLEKP